MFVHQGMYLPDGEKHFPAWMDKSGELVDGRGTYQIKKWRACLPWIKSWRTAVDCGAHVGFWSLQMAERFERVHAFEPMPQFRECFERNVLRVIDISRLDSRARFPYAEPVTLHRCALGAVPGRVRMVIPPLDGGIDSGGTHVDMTAEAGDVEMRTLDSFAFENVDFLKIDCEGFEHHVLRGAAETLKRCKPCVIVEQKPHKLGPNFGIKGTPAVDFLKSLGAVERAVLSGDHILSWD